MRRVSKAAASVACLVRVYGRVAGRYGGNGAVYKFGALAKRAAVDVGRCTPMVRRGGLSAGTARWRGVQ